MFGAPRALSLAHHAPPAAPVICGCYALKYQPRRPNLLSPLTLPAKRTFLPSSPNPWPACAPTPHPQASRAASLPATLRCCPLPTPGCGPSGEWSCCSCAAGGASSDKCRLCPGEARGVPAWGKSVWELDAAGLRWDDEMRVGRKSEAEMRWPFRVSTPQKMRRKDN
eukprot:scaffold19731_cov133-Isochrysis_galbana.AAC.1